IDSRKIIDQRCVNEATEHAEVLAMALRQLLAPLLGFRKRCGSRTRRSKLRERNRSICLRRIHVYS
ncbi:MAG: hypothetical protein RL692_1671, partial [Planctomycetota bacterium]